jgi:preprotein translocase subunit YajC
MIHTMLLQQTPAPASGQSGGGPFGGMLIPLVLMFGVFYFMLIRPQQKKQREQQDWLKALKIGDEVVTSGGLIGKITGITDHTVTLQVQEKVRLKVLRSHIAGKAPAPGQPGPAPEPEKK